MRFDEKLKKISGKKKVESNNEENLMLDFYEEHSLYVS